MLAMRRIEALRRRLSSRHFVALLALMAALATTIATAPATAPATATSTTSMPWSPQTFTERQAEPRRHG